LSNHVTPSIGRIVWYTPSISQGMPRIGDQPMAAMIVGVWSDACVNLTVFDANGNSHGITSVPLVQGDMPKPGGFYCEWMPYQKGQAAKTEKLEAALTASEIEAKGMACFRTSSV